MVNLSKRKKEIKTMKTEKLKYVYGTKTNKWYLVDKTDRDFKYGISKSEFKKIGEDSAKHKYLSATLI